MRTFLKCAGFMVVLSIIGLNIWLWCAFNETDFARTTTEFMAWRHLLVMSGVSIVIAAAIVVVIDSDAQPEG